MFLLVFSVCNWCVYFPGLFTSQDDDYSDEDYDDDTVEVHSTTNATLLFVRKLTNETRESDEKILMRCEVQNVDTNVTLSKVKIAWQKNYAPLRTDDDKRVTIKRGEDLNAQVVKSRLRIVQLNTHDSGYYTCVASSGKTKIKSEAFLKVNRERWCKYF